MKVCYFTPYFLVAEKKKNLLDFIGTPPSSLLGHPWSLLIGLMLVKIAFSMNTKVLAVHTQTNADKGNPGSRHKNDQKPHNQAKNTVYPTWFTHNTETKSTKIPFLCSTAPWKSHNSPLRSGKLLPKDQLVSPKRILRFLGSTSSFEKSSNRCSILKLSTPLLKNTQFQLQYWSSTPMLKLQLQYWSWYWDFSILGARLGVAFFFPP